MKNIKTKDLILCALFTALIVVGAFIRIPIPVVPFTLQFLFTMLAGLLLGGKLGFFSVAIYIIMGLIGLPVFAQGGGIGYIFHPTFGYIMGFAVAAYITGVIANKKTKPSYKRIFVANFIGLAIVYICGMIYYYLISNFYLGSTIGIWPLFLYCFILAVPGDIVLCILGAIIAKRTIPIVQKGDLNSMKTQSKIQDTTTVEYLKNKVINGEAITMAEAKNLYDQPLEQLTKAADSIREHFCGKAFDICTIINGKSGKCSEDCKFCAQSAHNHTGTEEYPLLTTEEILEQAKHNQHQGVLRYSIVTSGKKLSNEEVEKMCLTVQEIRTKVDISLCASFGLLNKTQYKKLKKAGLTRVHNNLETSRRNFPNICTTHTFDDKIKAIKAAQKAGLSVCSGGIIGLPGETKEDRIDMALTLGSLGIKSVPVNILNPILGTPFEDTPKLTNEEIQRIVAVYRFILPDASIRLAGGRGLLRDKGELCFSSGANAAISGDMLTTAGITIETDMKLLEKLGYEAKLCN